MIARRPAGAARPAPPALGRVVLASAALHGAVLAGLAWHKARGLADPPPEQAMVQVEYVNQAASNKGAQAPDSAPDQQVHGGAPSSAPPQPERPGDVPMPQPMPRGAAAPGTDAPPAVNLGDASEDRDALLVTGDDVVSSGPDARYRNMPPAYPHEAIRRHQQGTVQVLIHITPSGEAGEVEMITSSGSAALDGAARDAVAKWHFTPPLRDGVPVASVFPLQMTFRSEP